MPKHELKKCPRCNEYFECKSGSITQCQCTRIKISEATTAIIESQYNDCLCLACLQELDQLPVAENN